MKKKRDNHECQKSLISVVAVVVLVAFTSEGAAAYESG
jgi:hypothetical protein